jgi:DNA-binding response OmpR family regulator
MRILIVEDDHRIASFVKRGLEEEGFVVETAADGDEGYARAVDGRYDAILLDLLLPQRDGLSVSRALRAHGISTPILMLTAKDTLQDKVSGLDSGADDYLTKPFSFEELVARVRALLRRSPVMTSPRLAVADLTLDPATREVSRAGRRIALTPREYQLLDLLLRHAGQVLTRTILLNRIWGYDFEGSSNVLEAYIRLLRRKIDAGHPTALIHTVRGVGYTLKDDN